MTASPTLSVLLLAAADELTELAALADGIGASDLDLVQRLQPLDRLSQHLAGLATVLRGVATNQELGNALAAVTVAALADRLAGSQPAGIQGEDAGGLELF